MTAALEVDLQAFALEDEHDGPEQEQDGAEHGGENFRSRRNNCSGCFGRRGGVHGKGLDAAIVEALAEGAFDLFRISARDLSDALRLDGVGLFGDCLLGGDEEVCPVFQSAIGGVEEGLADGDCSGAVDRGRRRRRSRWLRRLVDQEGSEDVEADHDEGSEEGAEASPVGGVSGTLLQELLRATTAACGAGPRCGKKDAYGPPEARRAGRIGMDGRVHDGISERIHDLVIFGADGR